MAEGKGRGREGPTGRCARSKSRSGRAWNGSRALFGFRQAGRIDHHVRGVRADLYAGMRGRVFGGAEGAHRGREEGGRDQDSEGDGFPEHWDRPWKTRFETQRLLRTIRSGIERFDPYKSQHRWKIPLKRTRRTKAPHNRENDGGWVGGVVGYGGVVVGVGLGCVPPHKERSPGARSRDPSRARRGFGSRRHPSRMHPQGQRY